MRKRKKIAALGLASMALFGNLKGMIFADDSIATQPTEAVNSIEQNIDVSTEETTISGDDIVITGGEMETPQSADEVEKSIDNLERLLEVYNKYSGDFKYEINKDLNQEQINSRYDEIESKYKEGDELSDEDSEFVVRYERTGETNINNLVEETEQQITNLRTKGSHTFSSTVGKKSFSNSKKQYGLTMNFSGYVQWHNGHSGATQHKITVNAENSCYSNHVKTRKPQLSVKAYGLNVSNNIFVAYDKTIYGGSKSGTGVQYYDDSTGNYDVLIHVKTVVTPRTSFTTQAGSSTYIDGFK